MYACNVLRKVSNKIELQKKSHKSQQPSQMAF